MVGLGLLPAIDIVTNCSMFEDARDLLILDIIILTVIVEAFCLFLFALILFIVKYSLKPFVL